MTTQTATPAPAPARTASWLRLDSPIGTLALAGTDAALTRLLLPGTPMPATARPASADSPRPLLEAARQLGEYFAGRRTSFDLPLATSGTPFQRATWAALAEIPYGQTVSYAELAEQVGRPRAFRAVGQANGANPIPIVLPCHRVLASGGRLGGFGGGLGMKRALLALEGVAVS